MPIDIHLLNKIRSVKALRDKGATDGERDAAQHRLTVLLARHKLTEQDIPPDSFSSRGRSYTPPPRSSRRNPPSADFNAAWEDLMREFREAAGFAADERYRNPGYRRRAEQKQRQRQRDGASTGNPPPPNKRPPGRVRFEMTFGHTINDQAWRYVKLHQTEAQKKYKPSNPNAFSRAFYEFAAASLRGRIYGAHAFRSKTSNPDGQSAGQAFGQSTPLDVFTNAS